MYDSIFFIKLKKKKLYGKILSTFITSLEFQFSSSFSF